jgi:membrane-bound transcription factor site-1 protease
LPGYPVIDLGNGLNSTFDASNIRRRKVTLRNKDDSLGNRYLGLFYGDEV